MRSLPKSESHLLIETTVNRFVREKSPASALVSLATGDPDWKDLWPSCAELGLLAVAYPEEQGGLGGDATTIAVTAAALGPGLLAGPFIESAVIAGSLLSRLSGADDLRNEAMTGVKLVVPVDGRSATGQSVRFTRSGSAVTLSGKAIVQPFAGDADHWLVFAEGEAGAGIFVVPNAPLDARVRSYRLIDGHRGADVEFDNCEIPADALLLEGDEAVSSMATAWRYGRLALCAEAFGIMGALMSQTAEYLSTRVQFGKPIGSFQALQHRFADMQIDYARCHAAILDGCHQLDGAGSDEQKERAVLNAFIAMAASSRRVGHDAIQLHGGIGATLDMLTSHFNSRLAAIRRFDGGADAALVQMVALSGLN